MEETIQAAPKQRKSNFELLRILAMLMIVAHHYSVHGVRQVYLENTAPVGDFFQQLVTSIFVPGGQIGVGIFFLLTGYFMYDAKYKIERLLKLFLQVYFYVLLMFGLRWAMKYLGIYDFPELKSTLFDGLKSSLFPISSEAGGWFTQTYFILFLFIPIINKYYSKLNDKYALFALFFVWLTWYGCAYYLHGATYGKLYKGVFFYLLGAQLKRSDFHFRNVTSVALFVVAWAGYVVVDMYRADVSVPFEQFEATDHKALVTRVFQGVAGYAVHFVCIPLAVVSAFNLFRNMSISSKFINAVASTTFGIYLIHESGTGRPLIWNFIFHCRDVQFQSEYYPLLLIATVLTVFCSLSAIDYLRIRYVEKKYWTPISRQFNRLIAKATEK